MREEAASRGAIACGAEGEAGDSEEEEAEELETIQVSLTYATRDALLTATRSRSSTFSRFLHLSPRLIRRCFDTALLRQRGGDVVHLRPNFPCSSPGVRHLIVRAIIVDTRQPL